jgi:hypothetical protein
MAKKRTKKTAKKTKLDSKVKIRKRLMALWSLKCRESKNFTCIVCGQHKIREGETEDSPGVIKKVDAHHIISRDIKNSFLRYHLTNAACVCPQCHKFGNYAAHRNPVFFTQYLMENMPETWQYLLDHQDYRIDLNDRDILAEIESKLKEGKPLEIQIFLNLAKKKEREKQAKLDQKKESEIKGSLFDNIEVPEVPESPEVPIPPKTGDTPES